MSMEDYDFLTCEIRSEAVDAIINRCDICRVGHTSVEDYGRLGGVKEHMTSTTRLAIKRMVILRLVVEVFVVRE